MPLQSLQLAAEQLAFDQVSDPETGRLLRVLAAAKPDGRFLDLGTGVGHSVGWLLGGMTADARLISLDNDPELQAVARDHFSDDPRVEFVLTDGGDWIRGYRSEGFDLIFADTWPGKYFDLEETLRMVNPGGYYLVDDLSPQPNWPEGHAERAAQLTENLMSRTNFHAVKMPWSTGLVLMTKRADVTVGAR